MSMVQNTPRTGQDTPLRPVLARPSKSSREYIASAERACRTGQPRLAMVYLAQADVARAYERVENAAEWFVIAARRLELAGGAR